MKKIRETPGPGQESVWDYPRPPRLELNDKHVKVVFGGVTIADSVRTYRVLETSHPPVYYLPPEDILTEHFIPTHRKSYCEWKGEARYYAIEVPGKQAVHAAWYYPNPVKSFAEIRNFVAVYPGQMDACYLNDELVRSQEGDFYGGWITDEIVGPFKGPPGTMGW